MHGNEIDLRRVHLRHLRQESKVWQAMPSHIISVISLCWSLECIYISDAGDLDVRNLGALDFNKMGAGNCTGRNDASAITILQAIAIKSTIFLAIPSIYQSPPPQWARDCTSWSPQFIALSLHTVNRGT